jgi:transcriptional regulator with XRE-family HTH domain
MEDKVYIEKLGKKIFDLRHAQDVSQEKLASKIGTYRNQIARIEGGKVNSSINMLRKIAEELGTSISELVKIN